MNLDFLKEEIKGIVFQLFVLRNSLFVVGELSIKLIPDPNTHFCVSCADPTKAKQHDNTATAIFIYYVFYSKFIGQNYKIIY